ncbi:MAG TPA: GNAT family N-acetyltransferase [Pirellulales bacterium]|nr:GNAT family N-acetyltransferase [Pirellulales bacterium]
MASALELAPSPNTPSAPHSPNERFVTRTTVAEFAAWEAAWELLAAASPSPMQSFAWIEAAAATTGAAGRLRLIGLQAGEHLTAVAPLVQFPGGWVRPWELLNLAKLYEPADLVAADAAALEALAGELARRGLPLCFGRLPAVSPTIEAIRRAYRRGWVVCRPQASTPYIPLDESWSAPESKISSRRRSDFRRSQRHAAELGETSAEILSPAAEDVDRLLDLAFEVESRSWKGEQGTALARDAARGAFYCRYARQAASRGQLRVGFLRIGELAAAMQISVVASESLWVLKVGYDPQFQKASPGILLMVEQIKHAVAEGLASYELLGTVEPWIQVWTEHERKCVSLRAYPANFRGLTALASDAARKAIRNWSNRTSCKASPATCAGPPRTT